MNVKLAFLNGNLEEKVYGKQSPQVVVIGEEQSVCKLKKAFYELKQEPRAWNSRIDGYLTQNDFVRCPYKHVLYVKKNLQDNVMFICLYIDGLIFTGDDSIMFEQFN